MSSFVKAEEQEATTSAQSGVVVGEEPLLSEQVQIQPPEATSTTAGTASVGPEKETYWRHVRYNGDDEDIDKHKRPWRLQYVEGKGYIALSNHKYRLGDYICSEFPTVWVHGHHPFNAEQIEEILTKVAALDEEDRAAFYDMANVFSEEEFPAAVGIFMTNSFDMTDSPFAEGDDGDDDDEDDEEEGSNGRSKGGCCAMYLALARLNHSCIPNAQQTHIPSTTEEVLYASRDIEIGEEINDCYIDLRQDREARRHELSKYYRFHCTCPACEFSPTFKYPSITHSSFPLAKRNNGVIDSLEAFELSVKWCDQIRKVAKTYPEYSIKLIDRDEITKALKTNETVLEWFNEPMNTLWCIRYMPELYSFLAQIHTAMCFTCQFQRSGGNKKAEEHRDKACEYTQYVYNINLNLQGPTAPDTQHAAQMIENNWSFEAMQF